MRDEERVAGVKRRGRKRVKVFLSCIFEIGVGSDEVSVQG